MIDPDGVSMRDRCLVEWVAQASIGDASPELYCFARDLLRSVLLTLADLGVRRRPVSGTEWGAVAGQAPAAARAWLQASPDAGKPSWMR